MNTWPGCVVGVTTAVHSMRARREMTATDELGSMRNRAASAGCIST
jgi:hypothetical protein